MLKFNLVNKNSLDSFNSVKDYVNENVYACRNSIQFYPGI
jgi:hypothetical protein